jgi:hypothetical protein
MTRRRVLKTTAGAGAGAYALSGSGPEFLSPVDDAEAAAPLLLAGGVVAVAGVAMLAGGIQKQGDVSAIDQAEANELHDRIFADANEMRTTQDSALSSMKDNATLLREHVRTNVSFIIAERTQLGDSEQEVIDRAEQEVANTVAKFEKNLFNYWTTEMNKLARRVNLAWNQDALNENDVLMPKTWDGENWPINIDDHAWTGERAWIHRYLGNALFNNSHTHSYTLLNGETVEVPSNFGADWDHSGSKGFHTVFVPWSEDGNPANHFTSSEHALDATAPLAQVRGVYDGSVTTPSDEPMVDLVQAQEREGSGTVDVLKPQEWMEIHEQLVTVHDEEVQNATTLVNQLYDPIKNGEISATDIASGKAVVEASQGAETANQAAGAFRGTHIPEAKQPCSIETQNGVKAEGFLFWTLPNQDGLAVGDPIEPDGRLGEFHLAAEVTSVPERLVALVDGPSVAEVDVPYQFDASNSTGNIDSYQWQIGSTTYDSAEVSHTFGSTGTFDVSITVTDVDGNTDSHSWTVDVQSDTTAEWYERSEDDLETVSEGEIVTAQLTKTFTITGTEDGSSYLKFEDRQLTQPDDSPEDITKRLRHTYEKEQQTREERKVIIKEQTSGGGGALFGGGFSLFGLGTAASSLIAAGGALVGADRLLGN